MTTNTMTPYDQLKPGEHLIILAAPTEVDRAAFKARIAGLEIRDCLCIHGVNGPLTGLLVRSELPDTVVACRVQNGLGTIAIGDCRIGTSKRVLGYFRGKADRIYGTYGAQDESMSGHDPNVGRFPSNLLFVHGPGCVRKGTKKVTNKSGSVTGDEPSVLIKHVYGDYKGRPQFQAYGDNGFEEIADYQCQPNCPVALLDAQCEGWMHGAGHATRYGDEGSASRFFYQAITLEDLNTYLIRLASKVINP